ncbi:MAG: cell surface protein SprA, partial [Longimicrobiales bacterium]
MRRRLLADSLRLPADTLRPRRDPLRPRRDPLRPRRDPLLDALPADTLAPPDTLPADTIAQQQVPADTVLRLGLKRMPPLVPMSFDLGTPPFAIDETPFTDFVTDWRMGLEAELAAQRTAHLRRALRGEAEPVSAEALAAAAAAATDTVEYLPPLAPPDTAAREGGLGGRVGEYADLGMVVSGRSELGGSWTRYSPCDPSLYRNCNPSLLPQMRPDIQFAVRAGGTISDRVHINVDYDQRREFDAANNINVYYQGREHEILQRVEVGDVAIRLPSSRFLTQGIPAGNFGFRAVGQLGPIDFQTVFAQQKGDVGAREFRLAGGGGQQTGLVQEAQLVIDDADYVRGQFFFLLHPDSIAGAPHLDVLELQESSLPAHLRPTRGGSLQVYRDERVSAQSAQQQAQLGYFHADAVATDGVDVVEHSGLFRRLTQDEDYLVHPSGAWILLRTPLRSDEVLAVAYLTETGDTVGDLNAEQTPAGTTPVLYMLRAPESEHQPGRPTWRYEMHNIYRMDSSSGVDLSSIDLSISLGELSGGRTFVTVDGRQITYLELFGLDEDSPVDRIDQAQVYQPARETGGGIGAGQSVVFAGTYIVFPTYEPFFQPPAVPGENLSAAQAAAALGADANGTIYNDVDPVQRESGGRFRLTFDYRVTVDGLVSTFNLGAFGIREGSERLYIGDVQLQSGLDYTIDYDIGQVTLTDPRAVFGANPNAEIRATWEQKALFQIAPTSVFGMNARYDLGERGELNVVGLYQAEQTLLNRPQLGTEPGSIFLGGVSGSLDLGGALLDRALDAIPLVSLTNPSRVRLEGEIAMSAPNPNRFGDAYLDDFETSDQIPLDVRRQAWHLGSVPDALTGDPALIPFSFDVATAAPLVWQHDYTTAGGVVAGNVLPQRDVDQSIVITNTGASEPAMWITFGNETTPPDLPLWRSMTTVLSTTGRDFTRTEYLEFYVRARFDQPRALVFDIGTVGEDAFYFDSLGALNGQYPGGRAWGRGVLDAEARLVDNEVWGRDKDALGLWNQPCEAEPLTPYP